MIFWLYFFVLCVYFGESIEASFFETPPKSSEISFTLVPFQQSCETPLMEAHSTTALIPASVSKLFISYVALQTWPENHTFETPLYIWGKVDEQGRLTGKGIGLVGSWDPSLQKEDLIKAAIQLYSKGIRSIQGDLWILEDGIPLQRPHETHFKRRSDASQGVLFSSAGVDFGTIEIIMRSQKSGQVRFIRLPSFAPLSVLIRSPKWCLENRLPSYYVGLIPDPQSQSSWGQLETCLRRTHMSERVFYRPVFQPASYTGELFRDILKQVGIELRGVIRVVDRSDVEGQVEPDEQVILKGKTVGQIVWDILHYSNNYLADGLGIKWFEFQKGRRPRDLDDVGQLLREKWPFLLENEMIWSASGLDPRNRVSARTICRLLKEIYQRGVIYPLILNALPTPQFDYGTLKDRKILGDSLASTDWLRAKTGTLTSPETVVGLSGFLRLGDQEFILALIGNAKKVSLVSFRDYIDQELIRVFNSLKQNSSSALDRK